jgi:hypothetical protein
MKQVDRRTFLKMAGAGSTVLAAMLPVTGFLTWAGRDVFKFRAVTGLPKTPLPHYASLVIEGSVDLTGGSGTVTKTLYAGAPDAMSVITLPGTARLIRVTGVKKFGNRLKIAGTIDGEGKLARGEKRSVSILIDRASQIAQADFMGTEVLMRIE